MKILLINPNRAMPCVPPIGILHIASFLKSHGYPPHIVDLSTVNGELDLEAHFSDLPTPDIIGVSVRNIDSALSLFPEFHLQTTAEIIDYAKGRFPGVPILLGGAGFSIEPFEIMKFLDADFGIVGEGEWATLELVTCLDHNKTFRKIPGLIYRSDSEFNFNKPKNRDATALGSLPLQEVELIDYKKYYDNCGMASIQTKRGCALSCDYCTYPIIEGAAYRCIPVERVVDQIEFFVSQGISHIHFCDSVFNIPSRHAKDICKEIIRRNLSVRWISYISPSGFDDELAELFRDAGAYGADFGLDSCSEKMLSEMGKVFKKKDIYRATNACRRVGIDVAVNILFGDIGEDLDTVKETMDALDDIEPDAASIIQAVRVYRGTSIYKKLLRRGSITMDQSLLEPYFFQSELLPPDFSDIVHQYAISRDFAFCETNLPANFFAPDFWQNLGDCVREPFWRNLRRARAQDALKVPPSRT